jgi:hypothetical protein
MTDVEEAPESPQPQPSPAPEADAIPEVPLNAEGRERPRFLLEFPAHPELQRLVRAFEAGNYRAVREGAPQLAEQTEDAIVRAAARELLRRIDPDPLMKYLLWVALALFVFVVWHTYQGQP